MYQTLQNSFIRGQNYENMLRFYQHENSQIVLVIEREIYMVYMLLKEKNLIPCILYIKIFSWNAPLKIRDQKSLTRIKK